MNKRKKQKCWHYSLYIGHKNRKIQETKVAEEYQRYDETRCVYCGQYFNTKGGTFWKFKEPTFHD